MSSVSNLICKEELNLVRKVLRMLVKVQWVELCGTDLLFPILRITTLFKKTQTAY